MISPKSSLEERNVVLNGTTVRYLIGGEGPPLVMVHGFLGSAENFASWWDELSTTRTLIIPDLPGCGLSGHLAGKHTCRALGRVVRDLCRHLELGPIDLCGLCLGVGVVMEMMRHKMVEVNKIILHTPLLGPGYVSPRFLHQARGMMRPGVYGIIQWLGHRKMVSDIYKRLVVEGPGVDPTIAYQNYVNQTRAYPRAVREWLLDGMFRADAELLSTLDKPTLVLLARDDTICSVPDVIACARTNHLVTLDVTSAAGHGWTPEYVDHQIAAILGFLETPVRVPLRAG